MWLFVLMATAFGREGDEEACVGLVDGDACVRADGSEGTCMPDTSDPDVLTCDDDGAGSGSSSSSSSCDVSPAAAGWTALALAGLVARRRGKLQ